VTRIVAGGVKDALGSVVERDVDGVLSAVESTVSELKEFVGQSDEVEGPARPTVAPD
jgi:hypothetical protein